MKLPDLISLQSAIVDRYLHNIWTTFGMYVLAMGWIITSDKSRSFLLADQTARYGVVLAAVLILFIEIGILFFLQHKSESLYQYIQTTKEWITYATSESDRQQIDLPSSKLIVLETHRLTIIFPIISSIIAAILCFSFITMIVHLEKPEPLGTAALCDFRCEDRPAQVWDSELASEPEWSGRPSCTLTLAISMLGRRTVGGDRF